MTSTAILSSNRSVTEGWAQDKSHPDFLRARFPAHEIEAVVEQAVYGQITKLSGEENGRF